jgi:L-ascorbate metabolism protein UlaG (beta-lactamase superfamily)
MSSIGRPQASQTGEHRVDHGLDRWPGESRLPQSKQAAELCGVLRPRVAVPIHYRYTAGWLRDRLLLRYDGTPERFVAALTSLAPATRARVLEHGEPMTVQAAAP